MTRKRYIKLLMGHQGYSRNEARHKALADEDNHKSKSLGSLARRPQASYKEYYDCNVKLGGKNGIEKIRRILAGYDA